MKNSLGVQKILVTGGAGFIGTHLCRALREQGLKVTSLDLRKPETAIEGVEYVQGDVRNVVLLQSLVNKTDLVYHLAATVSVPLCQNDPLESYSNNFTATLMVLQAIRQRAEASKSPAIPMAFASTAALYGEMGNDGRALKEQDVAERFLSFYAAQKHASERAIQLYNSCHGVPAQMFRFFNVFGPGQDPKSPYSGVITVFSELAKAGKPLPLNGGGTQTRDFVSVKDIAQACVSLLQLSREQWTATPMNLGTGATITVKELAHMISELSGKNVEAVNAPEREGDVLHSKADIGLAKKTIEFKPSVGLREGLQEIVKK